MKVGDLVTSRVSVHRIPIEMTIGIPNPEYPKNELGIVTGIETEETTHYANVWWFCYDEAEKGVPPFRMPIKHLAILSTL